MPYLIDRQRALATQDIIAIVHGVRRRIRSRVILQDNSLYESLTRPRTFLRYLHESAPMLGAIGAKPSRRIGAQTQQQWQRQP